MVKKRKKRRPSKPPTEVYEVEIDGWEVSHTFLGLSGQGINGPEDSYVELNGELLSPEYKKVARAQIHLWADDHWNRGSKGKTPSTIGLMQVMRDNVTLHMTCSISAELFSRILVSLAAGKIRYVNVYGEKLRWARGFMYNIRLSTRSEED